MKNNVIRLVLTLQLLVVLTHGAVAGGMGSLPSPPYCPPTCTCN
ncbi:MAG TPA: hypothetical protein VHA33_24920 [Candidatus Angelobacter sp.]|jgi:hypothetical protein|nr:hypothetical protein [Candidatus Angelobacter sp.]